MSLTDVCFIIDMDGFVHDGEFLCRELGLIQPMLLGHLSLAPVSYRFDLSYFRLSEKDWRTARYCTRNIHGLPFRPAPRETDVRPLQDLEKIVLGWYERFGRARKRSVGYKGGCYERWLLEKLGIPSVNLESFGCPKFTELVDERDLAHQCQWHTMLRPSRRDQCHCVNVEIHAFHRWWRQEVRAISMRSRL